jgi:hypothetical protein
MQCIYGMVFALVVFGILVPEEELKGEDRDDWNG